MRLSLLLILILSTIVLSQDKPIIKYDEKTGDYTIRYQGNIANNNTPTLVTVIYEPPTKISPLLSCTIDYSDSSYEFVYSYTLTNKKESKQRLGDFYLGILSPSFSWQSPDVTWKLSANKRYNYSGWYNTTSESGVSSVYDGISRDSSVSGFVCTSIYPPKIVNAYFKGVPKLFNSFPDEPTEDVSNALAMLEKFPNSFVSGKTIGPNVEVSRLTRIQYINGLIENIKEARNLNWIQNDSLVIKYSNYLSLVAKLALNNNVDGLKILLIDIKSELELDYGLTNEVKYLMKSNVKYFLNMIK